MSTKEKYALAYARYGFRVFPCHEIESDGFCSCGATACKGPGKHPRIKDWQQLATTAEAQIAEWWRRWSNANIGVACGERSKLTVLDVDPRHGGDALLAELEAEHGELPLTPLVITGSGGSHYYFAFEPGLNNAVSFAPGLDIRTEGGLVIGVGSKTKDEYRWEVGATISDDPAAPLLPVCMPRWLVELITKHQTNKQSASGHFELPPKIKDGARNDTLYRLARSSRKRGQSFAATLAAVEIENRDRCEPPLASDEVHKTVTNAYQQPDRADFKALSGNPDVERLAALPPLEYDKLRKSEAKRLGARLDTLDDEVEKARKQHRAEHPEMKPAAQWAPPTQVSLEPIDGAGLMAEMIAAVRRFVMLDQDAALIAALWVLFTWVFEHLAETNPYLRIISPAPECGKSTLLKVIKLLARGGWLVSKITPSSFTRTMERERRSLLLDEGDAFLHENEVMRNVLDAASDPDTANISMSVKSGDDWIPAEFNVFVPIAIASIGMLRKMQTVESRSIHIHLKRATPTELKHFSKGRRRELKALLDPFAAKCARWATDNLNMLKSNARPTLPDAMSGREQDKWEPLVAIADALGPDLGDRARAAAVKLLSGASEPGGDSLGVMLLADVRQQFESKGDKLSSKVLCEALAALEGRPWAEYGKAQKPLSQNQLARLLAPFEIAPHTIRLSDGSTPKGYERRDFQEAFKRYLPDVKKDEAPDFHDPNRHNATTQRAVGQSDDFRSATEDGCGACKNGSFSHGEKDCGDVADRTGRNDADEGFSSPDEAEINRAADEEEGTEL